MKSPSCNGSDGSATATPLGPHVGEQALEDDLVREVVGMIHVLPDLVLVGVHLGVPVHEEPHLGGPVRRTTSPSVVIAQSSRSAS